MLQQVNVGDVVKGKEEKYLIERELGAGAYGHVYKIRGINTNQYFAMKFVPKENKDTKKDESALDEGRALLILQDCPGVPLLVDYFPFKKFNVLVSELLLVDLDRIRRDRRDKCFSKSTTCHIAYHATKILEDVHSFGILHRDVKPANLMVPIDSTASKLVLMDFGMACKFETNKRGPGMRLRVAAYDYDFASSPYHSINMSRRIPAQEVDDVQMIGFALLECRNLAPFQGTPEAMTIQKEQFVWNPSSVLTGHNKFLIKILESMFNQNYGSTPNYDRIYNAIKREAKIKPNKNFSGKKKRDGKWKFTDF